MAVAQANFKRDADDFLLDVSPRITSTSTLDPALRAESAREAAPGSILVTADKDILLVNLSGGVRVKDGVVTLVCKTVGDLSGKGHYLHH